METILITGAGGYIGSVLAESLLQKGYRVIGYDRFFFGVDLLGGLLKHPFFKIVKKDIRDVEESDLDGVDGVCDLAAISNDPSGDLNEELTYSINHKGRAKVAQTAKRSGVKKYILASSCSVYGAAEGEHLTEKSSTKPLTTYAKANVRAENDILSLASEGFCVTVLRQATVYGLSMRMRFDLVVNLMTLNAVKRGKIFITGGGRQWRPLIHVGDVSKAFEMVLQNDPQKVNGQIFNAGSSEQNYQILTLAYFVRENIPFPVEIEVVPDDKDKRDYNVCFDKIKNVLGFQPGFFIENGVKEIYDALKFGKINDGMKTITVEWYKYILQAKKVVDNIVLNDRIL